MNGNDRAATRATRTISACTIIFLTTLLPATSAAQETFIEEIVVTSQKRSESLQDVPVAVSAISEQALEDMGAQTFVDYARFLPSLSFLSRGEGNSTMQIRGISPPGFGTQATTAIYFDETPVGSQFGQPDMPVVDLERVELLRGPQGTLYGEGSIGGTLRLISNKPSTEAFTLSGTVESSKTSEGDNNYAGSAVVNIPLGERAALRASGSYRKNGGWIDGAGRRAVPASVVGSLALTDRSNLNEREIYGGRVALRLQPTDRLTIDISHMLAVVDGDDVNVDINDPTVLSPGFQPNVIVVGKYTSDFAVRNYREDEFSNSTIALTYDLDWAEITSATTWFDRELDENAEQPGYGFFPDANGWSFYGQEDEYFSHETRIASDTDSPLQWIAGVFYRDREVDAFSDFGSTYIHDVVASMGLPGQTQLLSIFTLPSTTTFEHKAVFGSLTYAVTDKFDVTLGLRYFEEEQSSDARSSILDFASIPGLVADAITNGTPLVVPFLERARTQFDTKEEDVALRLNATYDFNDDWMMYATAAEGFRSGGVNRNPATDFLTGDPLPNRQAFEADSLWNYEIGSKNAFFDKALIVNSAIFYIEWEDIQVPGVINGVEQRWTTNGGEARSQGAEVEFAARLSPRLYVNGSISYTDAELTEPAVGQPAGTPLGQVADWKYSLAVQYEFPISDRFSGRLRADYSFLDDQPQQVNVNSPINPDYNIVNFRAALEAQSWSVELFVDNLTNEYASLGIDNGYLGRFRNTPRTVGLRLRADLIGGNN